MELNQRILSDLIIHMKYARYVPELQRRELWTEICQRYALMMTGRYPALESEIHEQLQFVIQKKVLPSMRPLNLNHLASRRPIHLSRREERLRGLSR